MNIDIQLADKRNLYTLAVLTKTFFPYVNFSSEEIDRRLSSNVVKYLIATSDGATVGFADFEIDNKRCKLMGVGVLQEHRRNGIARQLVRRIIVEAQNANCETIFLLVAEDNRPAISLYSSFGFISKGKSDKILDNKPILIMEKPLASHLN